MNQIQQLINQMCPNGVEWKTLGEVCEMQRGTSLTKANSVEGEYPVISGGREPAFYCNQYNRDGETITIAGSGAGAGFVQYWNQKIFVNDSFSMKSKTNLSTRYLYYCLQNLQEQIYATKKGGGVPHVHISDVKDFQIPLPPLAIQTRIVEILDHFTNLTANLTAELNLRRKQFEHYREKLLSLDGVEGVEWKKLGEVGKVCMCKRIMKYQTTDLGDIPFYKIGTFGNKPDAYISKELFEEYKTKYSFPRKGEILISASGTIGKTVVYDGQPAYYQDSNIVWLANDESIVSNPYLAYCYQMSPWKVSGGGTIARLYNENIANAEIPIPPLATQHSIVSILDKFTALIENIEKELALRQKQYEYYREELLRFERTTF